MKCKYTKQKPLRVFTAFSGYDSQCMALDRIGIPYELVGWSEIDKYAIQAHNAVYPQWEGRNYGDISQINWKEVPDFDLFTYSFPCGLEGTMVKTPYGYKDISKVLVGELVATHNNRYREVIRTMSRICDGHYIIKAVGCDLRLTAEHPLWVLRDGVEQWIKVKDLEKSDKLSYCVPSVTNRSSLSGSYLWILGRYVADGFVNKHLHNSVEFAIGNKKEEQFLNNIPSELKDRFKKCQKSCLEYRVADKELRDLCLEFGNGSTNKRIPEWVLELPNEQIDAFLDGYFSGDGHVRYRSGTKVQMFSTVSKELFLGIQMLLMKRYNKVCSLSVRCDKRKNTFNDTYNGQIAFSENDCQTRIGFRLFVPIRKIEKISGDVQVFNLEVAEDNSYTCDNVNTHNCTDISNAGAQKGLAEGSETRSSLLWECRKAVEAKKPKYLLMENVKALVSKKFLPFYRQWGQYLAEMGYENFGKVVNATECGVPQNRERIFMVSIRRDDDEEQINFRFPAPFPLERKLKDVLEPQVDDKYVLSDKSIEGFLAHNENHEEKGTGFI
ncbi:MAG: DNA cytosine methyltransferase [Bacteroidales bacterium]|nr:DNA cytosine methyltransferase [Bacteroidales bacterium]